MKRFYHFIFMAALLLNAAFCFAQAQEFNKAFGDEFPATHQNYIRRLEVSGDTIRQYGFIKNKANTADTLIFYRLETDGAGNTLSLTYSEPKFIYGSVLQYSDYFAKVSFEQDSVFLNLLDFDGNFVKRIYIPTEDEPYETGVPIADVELFEYSSPFEDNVNNFVQTSDGDIYFYFSLSFYTQIRRYVARTNIEQSVWSKRFETTQISEIRILEVCEHAIYITYSIDLGNLRLVEIFQGGELGFANPEVSYHKFKNVLCNGEKPFIHTEDSQFDVITDIYPVKPIGSSWYPITPIGTWSAGFTSKCDSAMIITAFSTIYAYSYAVPDTQYMSVLWQRTVDSLGVGTHFMEIENGDLLFAGNYKNKIWMMRLLSECNEVGVDDVQGIQPSENILQIAPNPVKQQLYFTHKTHHRYIPLRVIDINGKVLIESTLAPFTSRSALDIQHLKAGIYHLVLYFDDKPQVQRFLVE